MPHILIHSSVHRPLACFHILAIVNRAAVNIRWASLVAQVVKNLPARWETWV